MHNCGERVEMTAVRQRLALFPGTGQKPSIAAAQGDYLVAKKCLVSGRVQGVYYRATIAQRARELGVAGHAINLPDGRVEVHAVGTADVVQTLIDFMWKGSSASHVTSVDVTDVPLDAGQRPTGFRTG
jgi:acylphosphatase